ncbi:MAG: DUF421 domain-containing protein [Bacilli bacterium]|nr:DUF421 domain-containing protein [Bacilli bacterium]
MNEITNVITRTLIVLIIIFISFKLMGKKQVSQMSMFDYITGITIGSIVADISLDIDKNLIAGLVSLLIYCITDILVSILSLKSVNLRNFFNSKEVPLIINGKINRENMSKNKITINILQTEARLMGYFDLDEINNAILEPNGMISFEPKDKEKPATKKDMGIKSNNKGLVYNLIIDGKILKDNLEHAKKTEKWLKHELKVLGKKLEDILLLTIDGEEKINFYTK